MGCHSWVGEHIDVAEEHALGFAAGIGAPQRPGVVAVGGQLAPGPAADGGGVVRTEGFAVCAHDGREHLPVAGLGVALLQRLRPPHQLAAGLEHPAAGDFPVDMRFGPPRHDVADPLRGDRRRLGLVGLEQPAGTRYLSP